MNEREEFKLKHGEEGKTEWLRRNGEVIVLTSRKSLRNFLRNRRFTGLTNLTVYRNGQPFTFTPQTP